jgi:nucleoside-diphosphate-sugar epimerase
MSLERATKRALIGCTGFVGTTLQAQTQFDEFFHSKNIGDIRGREYGLVVCAAAPAAKWVANSKPEADRENLDNLKRHLDGMRAERFILISTIDVYPVPRNVDENTLIEAALAEPYGRHRYELEQFVTSHFAKAWVVRLPALFGPGLRKNFIFDLIWKPEALPLTHAESQFQFYAMARLWSDLNAVMESAVRLINVCAEPVSAAEIARQCAGREFTNRTEKTPVFYDVQTVHAKVLGGEGRYHFTKEQTLEAVKAFIASSRGAHA